MKTTVILICFVFYTGAKAQNDACRPITKHEDIVECTCAPDETLPVFYDKNVNVTSLTVKNCASADLQSFRGRGLDQSLTTIKFKDIGNVIFCPLLPALEMETIEFLNVGCVRSITDECTSTVTKKIQHFRMENTTVELLDYTFYDVEVSNFTLINVTIEELKDLRLGSTNGHRLHIMNCHIKVTKSPLHLENFTEIRISNTIFEFVGHVGTILMNGTYITLSDNIFVNASVNATGKKIQVTNTCADGQKSAMRLKSEHIVTKGNKWPTQIIIPKEAKNETKNTEVCTNATCNCLLNHHRNIGNNKCHGAGCKSTTNDVTTNHQATAGHGVLLYFTIVASVIVAMI